MITASCQFCEDIRKEASGQETLVGVFPTANPIVEAKYLRTLHALVMIQIPFSEEGTDFGIRVAGDGFDNEYISPPPDVIADAVQSCRKFGLLWAALPVQIDLIGSPMELSGYVRLNILLVVGGKETVIGSFTARPPEA